MTRNYQEQADGAMTEILALIDTLQRLPSDACLLLNEQLRALQDGGWRAHGTGGQEVVDGARRCLHTIFPWVPYEHGPADPDNDECWPVPSRAQWKWRLGSTDIDYMLMIEGEAGVWCESGDGALVGATEWVPLAERDAFAEVIRARNQAKRRKEQVPT